MKIPKQIITGTFLGGIKSLTAGAMFYISMISFSLSMIIAYDTSIKQRIDIPFWIFFVVMVILVILLIIFEYVIMLPSFIAFNNTQICKHPNPIINELAEIKKLVEDKARYL